MNTRKSVVLGGGLLVALAGTLGVARTGQPTPPEQVGRPQAGEADGRQADREAIRATVREFTVAFNRGDAAAVAAQWTDQGEYHDDGGTSLRGREAIEQAYRELFKDTPNRTIEVL